MRIERRFTKAGQDPYAGIEFRQATSEIRNPDGSRVFHLARYRSAGGLEPGRLRHPGAEIFPQGRRPRAASAGRRSRRAGLAVAPACRTRPRSPPCPRPSATGRRAAPSRCSTASPAPGPIGAGRAATSTARTTPAPITTRCASCWASRWPRRTRRNGSTPACTGPMASTARRRATTTSITSTGELTASASAYEHPQPHACFIQSVTDDLVNEGGIMDLWVREARLFKYGSGTGSNFSKLRGDGERLSGGGRSSGLMSFLKIGDRAAGAIKSGGTTRRAAKMVTVDIDHPDIEAYIDWKVIEEQKVAALVAGSKLAQKHLQPHHGGVPRREREGARRRPLRSGEERAAEARDQRGAPRHDPRELRPARHPVRAAGLHRDRFPHLRHRLGQRRLSHRLRPELEQLGARHQRFPRARARRTATGT